MRFLASCLILITSFVLADSQTAPPEPALFSMTEVMVPVRDGVRLQTVILAPIHQHAPLPILLERTPYGVPAKAPTAIPARLKELAQDGYIFVIQNLRAASNPRAPSICLLT